MLREMKEPFDCVVNMEALAFTLDKVLCLLSDIADLAAENMVYPDTCAAWREVELRTDMATDGHAGVFERPCGGAFTCPFPRLSLSGYFINWILHSFPGVRGRRLVTASYSIFTNQLLFRSTRNA